MARDIDNSWQAAVPPTGRTITNYSLENNGVEVIEVGNVLVANGVTINDDLEINTRVRAKYDDNSYGPYSNVETIAAGSSYDPTAVGALRAWKSSAALMPEVSGAAGSNDFEAAGGSFTNPSNSGGWNTFNGTTDLIKLPAVVNSQVDTEFTHVYGLEFNDLTQVAATYKTLMTITGNLSQLVIPPSPAGKFLIRHNGSTSDSTVDLSNVALNTPIAVTFKRQNVDGNSANDIFTIQFGDATPITVAGDVNLRRGVEQLGGNDSFADRCAAFRVRNIILFDSEVTGQALADAKTWALAG